MEKRSAHYRLEDIQTHVLERGRSALTATALRGMDAMGLTWAEGMGVLLGLQRAMLFKSMTTHADNRVWQDVYHAPCPNGKTAYIKLTLREGAVVIQFKEK